MRTLLSPRQMREVEAQYLETTGMPSHELMERAAAALYETIKELYGEDKTVYFACGSGGNGGDGYACARMYSAGGGLAIAIEVTPASTEDCRRMKQLAEDAGVTITSDFDALPEPDLWVDAVFGTGLSRAPVGAAAEMIERMNSDDCEIVAVDVPSGLNSYSGKSYGCCVEADLTVTFHRAKTGLYLLDGLDMCGDIIVKSIGIPDSFDPDPAIALLTYNDVKLPPRRRNTHKGDYGRLLIIAGSRGMAGAAAICANAAMRTGAGLTRVACPECVNDIVQYIAPCATSLPLPEEGGHISIDALPALREAIDKSDVIAIGCGMNAETPKEIVEAVLSSGKKCVIDADALNIVSKNPELKALLSDNCVITPHPGEAARLLGRELTDPLHDAKELAAMGACAELKGASSVICSGDGLFIAASGCAGMAKGGSGDALTGMTAALLALGFSPERAACCACELHGFAGEAAAEEYGEYGMLATDLVEMISQIGF